MKFIDLFAGLGGFNLALTSLGHQCVFASEIDKNLADLYEDNFKISVTGDIKKVKEYQIPEHDIFCAGFPCQPFSKAGQQAGFQDNNQGNLFNEIIRILKYHKPKYLILENVANLTRHNGGETWNLIYNGLKSLGYSIDYKIFSPHNFNIPQIRERVFIVGALEGGIDGFSWPKKRKYRSINIKKVLDEFPKNARNLPDREKKCVNTWQEFLDRIPPTTKLPSFPIWSMEFGATYPYQKNNPASMPLKEIKKYRGSFGQKISGNNRNLVLHHIPRYAQTKKAFPRWKQNFIRQNREFYLQNKKHIDPVLPQIKKFPFSWQKFEWNCQGGVRNLNEYILQFRASGLRVKRPSFSPSLVASTITQTPIISWESRYMTTREGSRLQSMEKISLPENETASFRALGNAVNVTIVKKIANNLLIEKTTRSGKRKDYSEAGQVRKQNSHINERRFVYRSW